jgi:hypothetical protein
MQRGDLPRDIASRQNESIGAAVPHRSTVTQQFASQRQEHSAAERINPDCSKVAINSLQQLVVPGIATVGDADGSQRLVGPRIATVACAAYPNGPMN